MPTGVHMMINVLRRQYKGQRAGEEGGGKGRGGRREREEGFGKRIRAPVFARKPKTPLALLPHSAIQAPHYPFSN
jgi:hypothetical protein